MRRALIASGVLGLGTALVFGAAALTATLFPSGATIPGTMNAWMSDGGGRLPRNPLIRPIPVPGVAEPPVMIDDSGAIQIDIAPDEDRVQALP